MELVGDPEGLKKDVLAEAARAAAAIAASAEAGAAALIEAAEKDAEGLRLRSAAAARADGGRVRAASAASVPAEAARLRAARLEEALLSMKAEILAAMKERLTGPDGAGLLAALAAEAAAGIGGRSFAVLAAPGSPVFGMAGEIERLAGLGRLELRFEEDRSSDGGVAVRSADGTRFWDNGPAARLERFWPELRLELAERLFRVEGPWQA